MTDLLQDLTWASTVEHVHFSQVNIQHPTQFAKTPKIKQQMYFDTNSKYLRTLMLLFFVERWAQNFCTNWMKVVGVTVKERGLWSHDLLWTESTIPCIFTAVAASSLLSFWIPSIRSKKGYFGNDKKQVQNLCLHNPFTNELFDIHRMNVRYIKLCIIAQFQLPSCTIILFKNMVHVYQCTLIYKNTFNFKSLLAESHSKISLSANPNRAFGFHSSNTSIVEWVNILR